MPQVRAEAQPAPRPARTRTPQSYASLPLPTRSPTLVHVPHPSPLTLHPSPPLTPYLTPLTRCGATLGCSFKASSKSLVASTTCVKCKTPLKIRVPPSAPPSGLPSGCRPADHQPAQLSGRAYPGRAHLAEAPLVKEAGGWELHLSSSSGTGYKGVYKGKGKSRPYLASLRHALIGRFATAVEAAVAYARAAAGEHEGAASGSAPLTSHADVDVEPSTTSEPHLHRSAHNQTGYRGVQPDGHGFSAKTEVNGQTQHLGHFSTVRGAAVAYARAAAGLASAGVRASAMASAGPRPPSRGAAAAPPPVRSSLLAGTVYRRDVRIGAAFQAEVPPLPA